LRIHWKEAFKKDYARLEKRLKQFDPLRRELFEAIRMLQQGQNVSEKFVVNRVIAEGEGWYACYFYDKYVLLYKIEGQYVKLARLGTPRELEKRS
jgi:addiction module RelE/StbE family toxin